MATKHISQRMILLVSMAAWLLAFGQAPVTAIHVLSERMGAEEAQSVCDEQEGHDNDHGHPMPDTLLCRRPSLIFSIVAPRAVPCVPAPASPFTTGNFHDVVRDVSRLRLGLHLARSPVLRI